MLQLNLAKSEVRTALNPEPSERDRVSLLPMFAIRIILILRSTALLSARAATSCVLTPSGSRAERVGYSFQGALTPSPVSAGTHRYVVTVGNDFLPKGYPAAIDYFGIRFNSVTAPSPLPILVNGLPYTKTEFVGASPSWDLLTCNEADELKLQAKLPHETFYSYAGVARSAAPVTFEVKSLSRITPATGDYNFDGKIDSSAYLEWRKAFGGTSAESMHADGDEDGLIGAADYVLWRNASAGNGFGSGGTAHVPEPHLHGLAAACVLSAGAYRRRWSL